MFFRLTEGGAGPITHKQEVWSESPAAQRLNKAAGFQLQKDVWNDVGPAQHALQTAGLQEAVQLRQQGEHVIDEPETQSDKSGPHYWQNKSYLG